MGILPSLFGKDEQDSASYVRAWAKRRGRELRHSYDLTPENLFAATMSVLSTFGMKQPRRKIPRNLKGLGIDATEHFGTDAALFEVGCYLYFRLDLWLFRNKPHLREEISTVFVREFDRLFTEALGINTVSKLFAHRVEKYAELVRSGAKINDYHFYLSQLILRTKDGTPPDAYDFDHEPLNLNAVEDMGVKMELLTWEETMIPILVEGLKKYFEIIE